MPCRTPRTASFLKNQTIKYTKTDEAIIEIINGVMFFGSISAGDNPVKRSHLNANSQGEYHSMLNN